MTARNPARCGQKCLYFTTLSEPSPKLMRDRPPLDGVRE